MSDIANVKPKADARGCCPIGHFLLLTENSHDGKNMNQDFKSWLEVTQV